ncbi:MAG: RtcB family protein [candidate division Zixibacteria bacterium]|nr:RtcB family protein [candidate division Zixibacteria bacterium]
MGHIFGQHDEQTLIQLEHVSRGALKTSLMADGHVGYFMPIGGVAAYDNTLSPVGVGFDIACGNCAILTDASLDDVRKDTDRLADEIQSTISFGLGRTNKADDAPLDHELFDSDAWELVPKNRVSLKQKARNQLGTVGSGNHYVDVFHDEQNRIWVGVHFGSRGFGHAIASGFLNISQNRAWDGRNPPEIETLLDINGSIGSAYWELMTLAGAYAYAGREWVARKVVGILGAHEKDMIHNHHNFAWRERHEIAGQMRDVIVVRKGATPAFPGQRGFVGGSMADGSVIIKGAGDSALQADALYSTVHGAGRIMSRTKARGKINRKTGKVIKAGAISPEMMSQRIKRAGVTLRGGGLDESPHVYRNLRDVLAAQGDTIKILHRLTPLIVVMAGADVFDQYRD